ncbi:MAG: LysE family translocator [Beijerinckiaceae bacterium]
MAGIPEFLLTSFLIELTPGPNMAYLAALALSRGRKPALAAVAGVALGLMLLGIAAAVGLQALVLASPWLYHSIRAAGFLYLLWLAWETWQPPEAASREGEAFDGFRKGLITNLLNPKAGVFYIAVLPAFVNPLAGNVAVQSTILALLYVSVATIIHIAIVLFANAAGHAYVSSDRIVSIRRFLALGLVAVAVWFLLKT